MAGPLNTQAIHDAIAAQIQTVTGISANAWNTSSPAYPAITILPGSPYIAYHETPNICQMNLLVEVATNAVEAESAQIALSRFVNAGTGQSSSIIDALESDVTVAGTVDNIKVDSVDLSLRTPDGTNTEYVATFQVVVQARRR